MYPRAQRPTSGGLHVEEVLSTPSAHIPLFVHLTTPTSCCVLLLLGRSHCQRVLLVAGLALLLPLPVDPSDIILIPFGIGSIACGLHEHNLYIRGPDPRSELAGLR